MKYKDSSSNSERGEDKSKGDTTNEVVEGAVYGAVSGESTLTAAEATVEQSANEPLEVEKVTTSPEVVRLNEELKQSRDKYLRLYAEFDNYKKRTIQEKKGLIATANASLLKGLLPVVDDFERGMELFQEEDTEAHKALQEGVKLVYDKLMGVLKQEGVTLMEIVEGMPFDSGLHDAVLQKPVEEATMKGKIVATVEKGYLLDGHVLQFAKVVIGL